MRRHFVAALFAIVASIILGAGAVGAYTIANGGRIYRGVWVNDISLAGLNLEEATRTLSEKYGSPQDIKIKIEETGQGFLISAKSVNASYDFEKTAQTALALRGLKHVVGRDTISLSASYDRDLLADQILVISSEVSPAPQYPEARIVGGDVVINQGAAGVAIDGQELEKKVRYALSLGQTEVTIAAREKDPSLRGEALSRFRKRAGVLANKSIVISSEGETRLSLGGGELLAFLTRDRALDELAFEKLYSDIAQVIERDPQNPVFEMKGGRVTEFSPAFDGLKIKKEELRNRVEDAMERLEKESVSVEISAEAISVRTPPDFASNEINQLGIKELIGKGSSRFAGSPADRVHNIALASSRLNGILIPPGEVFSFNGALGDISAYTGYRQSYIISGGKTILGDGGGVCQVSTTFFRAALDAGLSVEDRRAHSYRVGYYEQDSLPGLDATIYSPFVDLKIRNDTPKHILIQTKANTKDMTLEFEFYGTDDGREIRLTEPQILSSSPAPETLYIDDPSLPAGVVEQVDYAAPGAKVSYDYSVEKNGEVLSSETFTSTYRPWQAKFRRGTGPAQ